MNYANRQAAGEQLAAVLKRFGRDDTVVLALPRGGIVLGAEVARELHAPLGLALVRKIGHPSAPEYAIGALAESGKPVYNESEAATIDRGWLKTAEMSVRKLIKQRHETYYGDDFTPPEVQDRIAIIVDDGIATGLTMEAAVLAVRSRGAKQIIVAVPVAARDSVYTLDELADEVIVLDKPETFLGSVGAHYQEFEPVDDEEVRALLYGAALVRLQRLPPVHHLQNVARNIRFPATRAHIARDAAQQGFSKTMIDFLNLFPADETFQSKTDFTTRCEELELFITQKRVMPKEILRSPQE